MPRRATTPKRRDRTRKGPRDRAREGPRYYYVYVIQVLGDKTMYVGQSGKTPEARLRDHQAGCHRYCRACRCRHYVGGPRAGSRKMRLRREIYDRYNPVATRREAEVLERGLARRLRTKGYHVIGGH